MTLVSDIINYAFRQGNLIASGATPTDAQSAEAVFYLNNIVSSVLGNEVGENLVAFPIGNSGVVRPATYPGWTGTPDNNWFVPENTRIMLNLDQPIDGLYLYPNPDDGCRFGLIDVAGTLATYPVTVYGNGRLIEGATSLTLNVNSTDTEWFYRADTGNWQKVLPLILSDTFPFPVDFDDYFITALAIKLNPSYGTQLDAATTSEFRSSRGQLTARYTQTEPQNSELGLIRLSKMATDRDYWGHGYRGYSSNTMFNQGWPW